MKKPYKLISERMHLRRYRVRAYLSPSTGRVLRIRAGCRTWRSIAEAVAHYAGGGPYASRHLRWRKINYEVATVRAEYEGEHDRRDRIDERNDALLTIARLSAKILRYQKRCKS